MSCPECPHCLCPKHQRVTREEVSPLETGRKTQDTPPGQDIPPTIRYCTCEFPGVTLPGPDGYGYCKTCGDAAR